MVKEYSRSKNRTARRANRRSLRTVLHVAARRTAGGFVGVGLGSRLKGRLDSGLKDGLDSGLKPTVSEPTVSGAIAAAKSDADKHRIQRAVAATDRKIDALVYELYGLTAEEIRIVEGSGS
jgi:hypothetical protein